VVKLVDTVDLKSTDAETRRAGSSPALGTRNSVTTRHYRLIAFGALATCFQLLRSAFSFFKTVPTFVRGTVLERGKYNELYALVEGAAKKLSAQAPKNIVMGLEQNFYVTTNEVVTALPEA
jgi:hypothetical protein